MGSLYNEFLVYYFFSAIGYLNDKINMINTIGMIMIDWNSVIAIKTGGKIKIREF